MKGMGPLWHAPLGASRIAIASCSEGLGFHGLFPFLNAPRYHRQRMMALRARVLLARPRLLAQKVYRLLSRWRGRRPAARNPIWLYRPAAVNGPSLPAEIPGIRVTSSWDEIIEAVRREQSGRDALRATVYSSHHFSGSADRLCRPTLLHEFTTPGRYTGKSVAPNKLFMAHGRRSVESECRALRPRMRQRPRLGPAEPLLEFRE